MSRRHWSPLLVLVAAAVAWLAWRFLPREWFESCCGVGSQRGTESTTAGAAPADAETAADSTAGPQPTLCAGVTRSGRRCSREAEPGSTHCWQHGGG